MEEYNLPTSFGPSMTKKARYNQEKEQLGVQHRRLNLKQAKQKQMHHGNQFNMLTYGPKDIQYQSSGHNGRKGNSGMRGYSRPQSQPSGRGGRHVGGGRGGGGKRGTVFKGESSSYLKPSMLQDPWQEQIHCLVQTSHLPAQAALVSFAPIRKPPPPPPPPSPPLINPHVQQGALVLDVPLPSLPDNREGVANGSADNHNSADVAAIHTSVEE